jgi:hypothetical protein
MLAVWQAADDIEVYESGWTFDHFYPIFSDSDAPCLEGWTTLTSEADITGGLIGPPIAYARPVGELVRCTNGACMVHPSVPESGTLTARRLPMRYPPRQPRLPADHDDRGLQ